MASALSRQDTSFYVYVAYFFLVSWGFLGIARAAETCVTLYQLDKLERYLFEYPQDVKARRIFQSLLSLPLCGVSRSARLDRKYDYHVNFFLGWDSNPAQASDQHIVELTTEEGAVLTQNTLRAYSTWFQMIQAQGRVERWNVALSWRHDQEGIRNHSVYLQGYYPLTHSQVFQGGLMLALTHDMGATGYLLGMKSVRVFSDLLRGSWSTALVWYPSDPLYDALDNKITLQWLLSEVEQLKLVGDIKQPLSPDWPGGSSKTIGLGWDKNTLINSVPCALSISWQYTTDSKGWSILLKNNAVRTTTTWRLHWQVWPRSMHKRVGIFFQWASQQSNLSLFRWAQVQAGIQWRFK